MRKSLSYDNVMVNNIRMLYFDKDFADMVVARLDPALLRSQSVCEEGDLHFFHSPILLSRVPGFFKYLEELDDMKEALPPFLADACNLISKDPRNAFKLKCDIPTELLTFIIHFAYTGKSLPLANLQVGEILTCAIAFELSGFLEFSMSMVNAENAILFLDAVYRLCFKFDLESIAPGFDAPLTLETSLDLSKVLLSDEIKEGLCKLKNHCVEVFRDNAPSLMDVPIVQEKLRTLPADLLVDLLQTLAPRIGSPIYSYATRKRRRSGNPTSFILGGGTRTGRILNLSLADQNVALGLNDVPAAEPPSDDNSSESENPVRTEAKEADSSSNPFFKYSPLRDPFFAFTPQLVHLQHDLERMFDTRGVQNCDVIIELDSALVYAHRCVLSAQSAFFAGLTQCQMQDSRRVSMKGLFSNPKSFDIILRFMYSGYVGDISVEIASDILRNIDFLVLKSQVLKRSCRCILVSKTSPSSFASFANTCFYDLKDSKLFASIVRKLEPTQGSQELIRTIKDVNILHAIISVLLLKSSTTEQPRSTQNDDDSEDSTENYVSTPTSLPTAIFLLSDELSDVCHSLDNGSVSEVLSHLQNRLLPRDFYVSDSPFVPNQEIAHIFGGLQQLHVRNGELCNILNRHITRVWITHD
jgi:hypothetical protein